MKIVYSNKNVMEQCKNIKVATKLFGGNKQLVIKLFSRINLINNAINMRDIINYPQLRFHSLKGELKGYYAIDVKSIRDPWRIIIKPIFNDIDINDSLDITRIQDKITALEIKEVSKHYE